MITAIVLLIKYLLPFSFGAFPFFGSFANFMLDNIDGDILMGQGMELMTYQRIDKAADYLSYIMMLWFGRKWKIRKEIIITFVIRTVGQFLFFAFGNDIVFFIFPNLIETLFMVYGFLLWRKGSDAKAYESYKKYFWAIWVGIIVFKFFHEYAIHVGRIDFSTVLFGFNNVKL